MSSPRDFGFLKLNALEYGEDPERWPFDVQLSTIADLFDTDNKLDSFLDDVLDEMAAEDRRKITNAMRLLDHQTGALSIGEIFVSRAITYLMPFLREKIGDCYPDWLEQDMADTISNRADEAYERYRDEEMGL